MVTGNSAATLPSPFLHSISAWGFEKVATRQTHLNDADKKLFMHGIIGYYPTFFRYNNGPNRLLKTGPLSACNISPQKALG